MNTGTLRIPISDARRYRQPLLQALRRCLVRSATVDGSELSYEVTSHLLPMRVPCTYGIVVGDDGFSAFLPRDEGGVADIRGQE